MSHGGCQKKGRDSAYLLTSNPASKAATGPQTARRCVFGDSSGQPNHCDTCPLLVIICNAWMPLDPTAKTNPFKTVTSWKSSFPSALYPKHISAPLLGIRRIPAMYPASPIRVMETAIRERRSGMEVFRLLNRRQPSSNLRHPAGSSSLTSPATSVHLKPARLRS